jgi:3-oxoacyl-[acyl-carrier-protein] synthase III
MAVRRDMRFMQSSRKVFKEVVPMVTAQNSDDMSAGDLGLICSFGAGYSVGSVLVERA